MNDNKKLLSENNTQENQMNRVGGDIQKSESVFASSWMRIQKEFQDLKKDENNEIGNENDLKEDAQEIIGKKKKDKSKKGKDLKLSDKISSADIKDWIEHKRHIFAFMEHLKTLFNQKDGKDIKHTFGQYYKDPNLPQLDKLRQMDEDALATMELDENVKSEVENLGQKMAQTYVENVYY